MTAQANIRFLRQKEVTHITGIPRPTPFQQLIINLITKDPNMTENALEHALKKQEGVTFTPDDMIIYKKQKNKLTIKIL